MVINHLDYIQYNENIYIENSSENANFIAYTQNNLNKIELNPIGKRLLEKISVNVHLPPSSGGEQYAAKILEPRI